jgi:hypothetical protein
MHATAVLRSASGDPIRSTSAHALRSDIVDAIDQRTKPLRIVGRMRRQRDANERNDVEAERFAGEIGVIRRGVLTLKGAA